MSYIYLVKKKKSSAKKKLPIVKVFTQEEVNQIIQEEIDKLDKIPDAIDALIEKFLPDEKILQTIQGGLEADKVISAMVIRGAPTSIADEQDGMKDANSMTKDFVDVPDWANRLKAADMGLRLKGRYNKDKLEIDIGTELKIISRAEAQATERINKIK